MMRGKSLRKFQPSQSSRATRSFLPEMFSSVSLDSSSDDVLINDSSRFDHQPANGLFSSVVNGLSQIDYHLEILILSVQPVNRGT